MLDQIDALSTQMGAHILQIELLFEGISFTFTPIQVKLKMMTTSVN